MKSFILKILLPYTAMFIAAYSATRLIAHVKGKENKNTPKSGKHSKRENMSVMDKILIIELIAIVAYVIVDFWVFYRVGAEPSTLTMSFFAVCGGENGFMAWIKTRKDQERMRKWLKEDEGKADEYRPDNNL